MFGNVWEDDIDGSKFCCEDGVRSVFEGNIGELLMDPRMQELRC